MLPFDPSENPPPDYECLRSACAQSILDRAVIKDEEGRIVIHVRATPTAPFPFFAHPPRAKDEPRWVHWNKLHRSVQHMIWTRNDRWESYGKQVHPLTALGKALGDLEEELDG